MAYNHEWPYVDPYRANSDWLINKVKEFQATLDSWKATIDALIEALKELDSFDSRLDALEAATADLDEIRKDIANLLKSVEDLSAVDANLQKQINSITIDYDNVLSEIDRLAGLFPVYLRRAQAYTDAVVESLNIEFYVQLEEIRREIEELKRLRPSSIINPIRGRATDLQTAFDLAYADMRDDCATVAQFSELGLTSNEFDAYGLNNIEFSLHSRTIFHLDYVTAPVTGLYKKISHAISEVLEFIVGAFTVSEFDALDLTSTEFDALNYSCLDYLLANDANRGLTVTEFSDIIKSGGSGILRTE